MKKFLYCISVFFMGFVLFSCKSKEVTSETGVVVENLADDSVQENDNLEESNNELAEKEMADRGFIGWIDTGRKNPSLKDGLIRVDTNSKLGTFCIYAVDLNGKAHSVLSSLNEYTSSSFSLKAGNKILQLSANNKVKTGTAEIDNGVRLVYDIKNTATVIVEMEAFSALKDRPADTLKITATVKNIGKRVESFALKTLLDTVLGENGKFHFYNCEGVPVKNEALYRSMKENKWFLSKNDKASMQILLDGGDVTPVEFVTLANYKNLEKSKWMPSMQAFGAFDTVLSYNNSAIEIVWPEQRLYPNDSYSVTFYISVGLDGMTPNGYKYVYNIETPEPVVEPEVITTFERKDDLKVEKDNTIKDNLKDSPAGESVTPNADTNQPVIKENNIDEESVETPGVPNIEFNVKDISKDHLTTEYIQSLIDRIAELEKAGSSANRAEILQLNAELDAILSILR